MGKVIENSLRSNSLNAWHQECRIDLNKAKRGSKKVSNKYF